MPRSLRFVLLFLTVVTAARIAAAAGTIFTITSAADSGAGTLRQALLDAQASPLPWTFNFNIPGPGPHTITLLSPLPYFGGTCLVDGYTQPGSSPNSSATSDNAVINIVIDGSGFNNVAMNFFGNGTLRGIVYRGYISLYNSGNTIAGCFLGTNNTGTAIVGTGAAVYVAGSQVITVAATFGGPNPADRNIIAASNSIGLDIRNVDGAVIQNNFFGVAADGVTAIPNEEGMNCVDCRNTLIADNVVGGATGWGIGSQNFYTSSANVSIVGNKVGVGADGFTPVPNGSNGVLVFGGSSDVTIGTAAKPNIIANNGRSGISIGNSPASIRVPVRYNSIYGNAKQGIDLNADNSVQPNDAYDTDAGANDGQNFPLITSAIANAPTLTIAGTLSSFPNQTYEVQLFSNTTCDAFNGQGKTYLGETNVLTDAAGNGSFSVALSGPSTGIVTATATDPTGDTSEFSPCTPITPAQPAGVLQFSTSNYTVHENGGNVTVTVNRAGGSTGAASVHWATGDGTAAAGSDYTAASGNLNWAAGDSTSKSFQVAVSPDGVVEGDETFRLSLSAATGASLGNPSADTVTIIDDTPAPAGTLQFQSSTSTVLEYDYTANQFTSATLTVTRSGGSSGPASVHYATGGGTATAGSDYGSVSGTFYWAPGDVSSRTVTVHIVRDNISDPNETFNVVLSGATGAALGAPATSTVTIVENGAFLSLQANQMTVNENVGTISLNVVRSGDTSGAANVSWSTTANSATAGSDFVAASGTLNWAAGDAAPKTIQVQVIDDNVAEPDELFYVQFTGSTTLNLNFFPYAATSITIAANDVRGDANGNGAVEESDIFYLLNYLFAGGDAPVGVGDANSDNLVNGADVVFLINDFFAGGPKPAP